MSGKQETTAASTTPETIPNEPLSVLDLETELEKAKASLVTLGKRISALKNRLNTPEQQFGDRALIADLQKKFISETNAFNLLKHRLESTQDDSDAAYLAAIESLLGGGEVFAAPLLELTAEKESSSNGLPESAAQQEEAPATSKHTDKQAVKQEAATVPEDPADIEEEDDEPENTTEAIKKNSHRRTKDSFLKVERAKIQVTIHEQLAAHCLSGKTDYIEVDVLIAPLLNRHKVYYKDQELIDDDALAKLAEEAGYLLHILPSRKGHGGNKKSYRYFKKPSDTPPLRRTPDPEPLQAVTLVPKRTSSETQNGKPTTADTIRRTTVFNNASNQAQPKPTTDKPSPTPKVERKASVSVELSYSDIKKVISQSYANYKETYRRLVGAEPAELSLTRAARVLVQMGFNFPSNAIREHGIAIFDSTNWMLTAPVFVAVYNLLMEKVTFDKEVGDAFQEVKAEEMAKV